MEEHVWSGTIWDASQSLVRECSRCGMKAYTVSYANGFRFKRRGKLSYEWAGGRNGKESDLPHCDPPSEGVGVKS